jgi:hypothetical protein
VISDEEMNGKQAKRAANGIKQVPCQVKWHQKMIFYYAFSSFAEDAAKVISTQKPLGG